MIACPYASKHSQGVIMNTLWFEMDHYIIFHLFWYCRAYFRGMSYFGDLGSWNFQISFASSNDCFWGQNCAYVVYSAMILLYMLGSFQWHKKHRSRSLYEEVTPLAVDIWFWPPWYWVDAIPTFITHTCGVSIFWTFKNILEGLKP